MSAELQDVRPACLYLMSKSAISMWAPWSSGVAFRRTRPETVMARYGRSAAFAAPGFDAVDVGEGYDAASPEDFYAAAISE